MAHTFGSGPAAGCIVTLSSTSARIATADIVIAVRSAVSRLAWINGVVRTAVISNVKKGDWIIATGNAPIGIDGAPRRQA